MIDPRKEFLKNTSSRPWTLLELTSLRQQYFDTKQMIQKFINIRYEYFTQYLCNFSDKGKEDKEKREIYKSLCPIFHFQALQSLRKDAVEEFGADTTAHERVEFIKLDMASLKSTMSFIEEFKRKGYPLHLLILNGGCLVPDKREKRSSDPDKVFFIMNILLY